MERMNEKMFLELVAKAKKLLTDGCSKDFTRGYMWGTRQDWTNLINLDEAIQKAIDEMKAEKLMVNDHKKYCCFEYESSESAKYSLGDIVFKKAEFMGEDVSEIGVIIQIHGEDEYRTDMFGNCSCDEITPATLIQVGTYRPELLNDIK